MKVAVIGTGNMGSALAELATAAGYDVVIGARQSSKAEALAERIGKGAKSGTILNATKDADLVILAVTYEGVGAVIEAAGGLAGKTVMDITNPLSPDYMSLTVGYSSSAAEEIAALAPKAHVVKAFNTIFAQILPHQSRVGKPAVQVFTAADDENARETVSDFIKKTGFEPINAGPLKNARFIEPVAELNIHLGYALGWGTNIAPAWVKI